MTSEPIEKLSGVAQVIWDQLVSLYRILLRYRKGATRSVAGLLVILGGLSAARELYYKQTDPRIEPGPGVFALTPLTMVQPDNYKFSLTVVGYEPRAIEKPDGWWARLNADYDRDSRSEAETVTIRTTGPGDLCRQFKLEPGKTAVYAAGDAELSFSGMYNGRARVRLQPVAPLDVSLTAGQAWTVPGTDLMLLVSPGDPGNPRELFCRIARRGTAASSSGEPAVVGASLVAGTAQATITRVLPNEVTFSVRTAPLAANQGCGCGDTCQ